MFKFLTENKGKIRTKVLATFLVIALTFSNFALLGKLVGNALISYGSEIDLNSQDNSTNSENVKFDVYLEEGDSSVKQISKDLNNEELRLYVAVKVQGGGYLSNGKIVLENTNFVLRENEQQTEVEFDTIQSEKSIVLNLPIRAKKLEQYNINLLDMISQIKLVGKYKNNDGNEIDIESTKGVQVIWNAEDLTEENKTELSTEIITNQIYKIAGENKRVVQEKITSGIQNNAYPIKNSQIEIEVPTIGETQTYPEKVVVASYGTIATNGKSSVEFGNLEEGKQAQWSYNEEEHKIIINVENMQEENTIAWNKSGKDEFIVTYVYNEQTETTNIISKAKNKITLYTKTLEGIEATLENLVEKEIDSVELKGDAITLETSASNKLYTSNMLIGKETEFTTNWKLKVGYAEIAEAIVLGNMDDVLIITNEENNEEYVANSNYKLIEINKEEFLKIFGAEGIITILSQGSEENAEIIGTINNDSETNEKGNIVIECSEEIESLMIQTSKPILEGTLNIYSTKQIQAPELEKEEIEKITALKTNTALMLANAEGEEIVLSDENAKKETTTKIENPTYEIKLGLDKTDLSVTQTNNINVTATLKTNNIKYGLYKNPVIEIVLPKEIEKAEIKYENILNGNGLEIEKTESITNNEQNKIIKITTKGEQKEYIGEDTQITVNLDIETAKIIPTLEREITLKCTNEEQTIESKKTVKLIAEQGILIANSISEYNPEEPEVVAFKTEAKTGLLNAESEEKVLATVKGTVINNNENNLANVEITGEIKNENTNIETILKSSINVENAKVYYTKDEKITEESEWTEEHSEEAKAYKIVFEKIQSKQVITFDYKLEIPENIGANKVLETSFIVKTESETKQSPVITLQTEQEAKLELKVEPVSQEEFVYEEATLGYVITVTNAGEIDARNVVIDNPVPEGTTLKEGTQNKFEIEKIAVGETVTKTVEFIANKIEDEAETKTIENKTIVTAKNLKEELTSTINTIVKKAIIKIDIQDGYVDNYLIFENGQIFYSTTIENLSGTDLENLEIVAYFPENTIYLSNYFIILNSQDEHEEIEKQMKLDEEKITYKINKLEKDKKIRLNIKFNAGKLNEDIDYKDIIFKVEANIDQTNIYSAVKEDKIVKPKLSLNYISKNNTSEERNFAVNKCDEIEYIAEIINEGECDQTVSIEGEISPVLSIKSLKYSINGAEEQEIEMFSGEYSFDIDLEEGQKAIVKLVTTVDDITTKENINITNKIKCATRIFDREGFGNTIYSNEIEKTIEYVLEGEADEPTGERAYKISGLAWLDENENGQIEGNEKLLKGILVKLVNAETKEYLKDNLGQDLKVITDSNGMYEFNNLKLGKYIVEFEYNKSTYKLTPVAGQQSKANTVTTEEGTKILTDTITIINQNIENINIGLVLNPEYDLKLDKYITKVTVKNNQGTKVYTYNKEQLAKVEIKAKYLSGSTVIIEYAIDVTNEGAVPGYAKTIVDYLSPELKFNSELNTSWYQGTDNNLYCVELAEDEIAPGETKQVKLVLTKTMTNNNTGLVNNTAEIYEDFNEYALKDSNSTAGNKEEKENDMDKADIIITISTGSPVMYIGIVIASMAVLGLGIYLINKKVLTEN